MLRVNARVGASAIHGLGLFAKEFIPTGITIWEFMPGFDIEIPVSSVEILSPSAQQQLRHYAEYVAAQRLFVLSGDDDRFTNHSDTPNTRRRDVDGQRYQVVYATRDILAGEEITCDYREVVMLGFQPESVS